MLFRHPPRIEAGEEYAQAQRHKRHSVDQKAIGRVIALRHWKSRRIAGHKTCLTKSIQPAAPGPSCSAASVRDRRSEEHTSELQSLMRISYAVFCLTKNNITTLS